MDRRTLKKYLGDKVTSQQISQAIALINGEVDPQTYASVEKWVGQCHTFPQYIEMIMCALNEVLEGCGVEALEGEYVNHYYWYTQAEYINFGDTYIPTIIYDNVKQKFLVSSWGDFVEANPKRFPSCDG